MPIRIHNNGERNPPMKNKVLMVVDADMNLLMVEILEAQGECNVTEPDLDAATECLVAQNCRFVNLYPQDETTITIYDRQHGTVKEFKICYH